MVLEFHYSKVSVSGGSFT